MWGGRGRGWRGGVAAAAVDDVDGGLVGDVLDAAGCGREGIEEKDEEEKGRRKHSRLWLDVRVMG